MSKAIIVGLAIYCTLANLIGLLTVSSTPTYIRDAIIATALIISSAKISILKTAILFSTSALIIIACITKGLSPELAPKIRNYAAFPFLCLIITYSCKYSDEKTKEGAPELNNSWVAIIYAILISFILAESIIYILLPEFQALAWATLSAVSEEKGVSVGLGGGLLNGTRAMTPLLSPVQGSFVAFTALVYMQQSKKSTIFFYLIHIFTLSKITLIAELLLKTLQNLTPSRLLAALFTLTFITLVFFAFTSPESIEINIESIKLHLSGAGYGIIAPIDYPFGLPLEMVGALSFNEGNPLTPGFESFLGSISASFGWPGFLMITASIIYFGSKSKFMLVIFFMWLLSDNVSSPHLFVIPIFWVLLNNITQDKVPEKLIST